MKFLKFLVWLIVVNAVQFDLRENEGNDQKFERFETNFKKKQNALTIDSIWHHRHKPKVRHLMFIVYTTEWILDSKAKSISFLPVSSDVTSKSLSVIK